MIVPRGVLSPTFASEKTDSSANVIHQVKELEYRSSLFTARRIKQMVRIDFRTAVNNRESFFSVMRLRKLM